MGTRKEKLLQKLNPKLLKMTPKLSGDAGSFIELDSGNSLEDGAKNLMIKFLRNQDLCEKNKRNVTQNVTEMTVSCAKYGENNEICEIISEKLTLPFVKNEIEDVNEKPGKRLQKLKMELQEKMSAKWEEEYKKRVNEKIVYNKSMCKHKESLHEVDSNNEDSLNDEENDAVEKESCSNEEFGDDEDDFEFDVASIASKELYNEDNCDKSEKDNLERDDDYDSADGCSLVPAYQPGGGMLYGGSELTQCDEGLPQNLLSPSLKLSINESPSSTCKLSSENLNEATPKRSQVQGEKLSSSFTEMNKLFLQNPNNSFDLNEAFEFCSGKFPDLDRDSQSHLTTQTEENIQDCNEDNNDGSSLEEEEEEEEECGGESQTSTADNEQENSKIRKNIIAFEDSDVEGEKVKDDVKLDEVEEINSAAPELLSDDEEEAVVDEKLKKRRKPKILHFSDDEDSVNDRLEMKENEGAVDESEDDDDSDESEERSVHYDSEENEIINPKEFFEKEAELSGSEYSGDEDERGLDVLDVEEGDADKLDNDQVRSQLEKIHIRRLLDDDAREVRLIQEILFEDGDLHSDGKRRDRKFKWKNLGTFDENLNEGEKKEEGDYSSEDDGAMEEELRKIRHEKELFFMTKKKDGDVSSDEEIVEEFHTVKVTSVKALIRSSAKVEGVENPKTVNEYTKTTNFSMQNSRGSFLTRNEQFLSKLAKATSGVTENILGPKSSKNFVFTTKSPEKKNLDKTTVCKRQMEEPGSCTRDKKIKLLLPEVNKEPSILDLLV